MATLYFCAIFSENCAFGVPIHFVVFRDGDSPPGGESDGPRDGEAHAEPPMRSHRQTTAPRAAFRPVPIACRRCGYHRAATVTRHGGKPVGWPRRPVQGGR